MGSQMGGKHMIEKVTIPRDEYEALLAAREDLEDLKAVQDHLANPGEAFPSEVVKRLIDGDSPLRVFRQWRGLSQSALAAASGVSRVQIIDIEAGRATGSVATLKKLAAALDLTVDDLV